MVPVSRPASAASRRLSPLGPVASLCTVGAQHVLLELGRESVEVPPTGWDPGDPTAEVPGPGVPRGPMADGLMPRRTA